jgi:hypothetical protein
MGRWARLAWRFIGHGVIFAPADCHLWTSPAISPQYRLFTTEVNMAEDVQSEGTQPAQGGIALMVDERDMRTVYCNNYRISTNNDEVVVDLCFLMMSPTPQQGGQQQMILKANDRVIINYTNAKRLALSLGQIVKRYEQQFGELALTGPTVRK